MRPSDLPDSLVVAARALGPEGGRWLDGLSDRLAALAEEWCLTVGSCLGRGNAGYLAEAVAADGRRAVLKLALPDGVSGFSPFHRQLEALLGGGGDAYVEVIRHDESRRAILLERLGPSLGDLGLPVEAQLEAIADTVPRGWKRVPAGRLELGDDKARWLRRFIVATWEELGRPCAPATVERACSYAEECEARFDPRTAVVVHGDAHPYNLLEATGPVDAGAARFKLTDPEGLLSEPANDLGVPLRGWNAELLAGDTLTLAPDWCLHLATLTGTDPAAVWQWSFVERVSSGLFLLQLGHEEESRRFLEVADRLASQPAP